MTDHDVKKTSQPHDRLTRIANDTITAARAHPDWRDGDKVIVFMNDTLRGGIGISGYDDDVEPLVDLFLHLRAMFRAQGKDLQLHGLGQKAGSG